MRKVVFARDGYTCQDCGFTANAPAPDWTGRHTLWGRDLEGRMRWIVLDHIFPAIKGGLFEEWNLQTLCEPCNQSKGGRDPFEDDHESLSSARPLDVNPAMELDSQELTDAQLAYMDGDPLWYEKGR